MDDPPETETGTSQASPSRILFLDDDPRRASEFLALNPDAVWVQTVGECLERLSEAWHVVHLDHDLGGEIFVDSSRADCGMEVVRRLCDEGPIAHLAGTFFVVHTHNMNAAGVMVNRLREAGYETIYRPFGLDVLRWLDEAEEDGSPSSPPPSQPPRATSWLEWLRQFAPRMGGKGSSPP
jgi:hypothetical protein